MGFACFSNPVRPKARLKVNPCGLLVGEHLEELKGADCALAHELIVDNYLKGVKYFHDVLHIYFQLLGVLLPHPEKGHLD